MSTRPMALMAYSEPVTRPSSTMPPGSPRSRALSRNAQSASSPTAEPSVSATRRGSSTGDLGLAFLPLADVVANTRVRLDERAALRAVRLLGAGLGVAVPVDLAGVVDRGVVGLAVDALGVGPATNRVVGPTDRRQ